MSNLQTPHVDPGAEWPSSARLASVGKMGIIISILLALATAGGAQNNLPPLDPETDLLVKCKSVSPWEGTPLPVVQKMLEMAKLRPDETLYDLGSGDGRILIMAAQKFGARAVGIELDPRRCALARERIAKLGLEHRLRIIEGDMMEQDLHSADVITIFLIPRALEKLRPRLEKYGHAGLRVVICEDQIPEWNPTLTAKVQGDSARFYRVTLYEMPHSLHWIFFSSFGEAK